MIIAMTAAMHHLVVICLGGGNVAQARTAAHHIHQHNREFGAGDIGDAFEHQAEARAGGRAHHTGAGAGCAIDHVNGAQFAFGLDKSTAQFGHAAREVFQQFGLGGDGVAKIGTQSGAHSSFSNGFVALHQFTSHIIPPP